MNVTDREPRSNRTLSRKTSGFSTVALPAFDFSQRPGPRRDVGITNAGENTWRRGETQRAAFYPPLGFY